MWIIYTLLNYLYYFYYLIKPKFFSRNLIIYINLNKITQYLVSSNVTCLISTLLSSIILLAC